VKNQRRNHILKAVAAAALLLSPVVALGSTLADYQSRIDAAHKDAESMISALQAGSPGAYQEQYLQQKASHIRKTVPVNENVDLSSSAVETQNGWLQTELNRFDQESDKSERIILLSAISERLSSIDDEVKLLQNATTGTRSKDEDKQKLNEILNREEYKKPEDKGESFFQRWVNWFLRWIRSLFPDSPQLRNVDRSGFQPVSVVIQIAVYALVIGLIGFLIYKFAPVIAERFGKREKKESTSRVILGEHIDASRSATDLFAEAENFARQGDLRAAIRKGYIALLCDLADRKVIGLARHKTNRDYLRDVRKRAPLFARMKNATGSFERHWYGFRTPEPKDWEEFREQYRSAVNEI
jgi:hypothetical protein